MSITFLEKDLEDILYDNPQELVRERGMPIFGYDHIFRQVPLGNYGIADLITVKYVPAGRFVEQHLIVNVYELKQQKVTIGTLLQGSRYAKAIERIVDTDAKFNKMTVKVKVVLIGKYIETESDFPYLLDIMESVTVYTYTFDINGIRFINQSGFYSKNEGNMQMPKCVQLSFSELRQMVEPAYKESIGWKQKFEATEPDDLPF